MKYRSITYRGYKIEFVVTSPNHVFAHVPSITRQALGFGKNKQKCTSDIKRWIDNYIKAPR
jgi:hypothetical protein